MLANSQPMDHMTLPLSPPHPRLSQPVYVVSKHTIPTETQDLENLDVQKHHSTVDETSDYVSKSNHTAKSAEEDPLPPTKCAGSDNNSSKNIR